MDALIRELVEGVDEIAAMAHGDDVTILTLRDRKAERKRAGEIVAMTLAERNGVQDCACAVAHDHFSIAVDIGVAVHSVT